MCFRRSCNAAQALATSETLKRGVGSGLLVQSHLLMGHLGHSGDVPATQRDFSMASFRALDPVCLYLQRAVCSQKTSSVAPSNWSTPLLKGGIQNGHNIQQ
ncbi:unnamed protein product [Lepidochelys olivacea]